MESGPASDELPEREWQPLSLLEHLQCVDAAITKLKEIANRRIADIQADFVAAANELSMLLQEPTVMELTASFFDAVRKAYPEAREPLRKIIAEVICRESKFQKQLAAAELEKLKKLHAQFEDPSLGSRLQQHVGQAPWEQEELPDITQLAKELIAAPDVLVEQWPWLTSGEAHDAWRLGETLAAVDLNGKLAETLPSIPGGGRDLRLLCGYVCARRRSQGDEWYNRWVKLQFGRDPKPIALLIGVVWSCGATEYVANMVVSTLRNEQVSPNIVGQLGFGPWAGNLSGDLLEKVLRAMVDTGHQRTAIGILAHRMKSNPAENERWKPLALELVTASDLIRGKHMVSYYWKEVAKAIVADHPSEIAAAIFREQADHESGTWFAEHSDAAGVLLACSEYDRTGVWTAMKPYLSSPVGGLRFSIGFPRKVLERMPAG